MILKIKITITAVVMIVLLYVVPTILEFLLPLAGLDAGFLHWIYLWVHHQLQELLLRAA